MLNDKNLLHDLQCNADAVGRDGPNIYTRAMDELRLLDTCVGAGDSAIAQLEAAVEALERDKDILTNELVGRMRDNAALCHDIVSPTKWRPIQITAVGCENTITTQCQVMLFALMNDGAIRMTDNNRMMRGEWVEIPQ